MSLPIADWVVLTEDYGYYTHKECHWNISEGILYLYRGSRVIAAYTSWISIREKEPSK